MNLMTMKNKKNKKAIILLSGGLDSLVSLAVEANKGTKIELALTFDYGQKSFENEKLAAKNIADYYKIENKIIQLDWLKNITNTSLVKDEEIPQLDIDELEKKEKTINSMKNVWVPNRNGLFVNIAASFCDSYKYDEIIIGANKEEAKTFSDNSKKFVNDMNKVLKTSTNYEVKLNAPLINMSKNQIIKKAIELNTPIEKISSCYNSTTTHCGKCESCQRLKRALLYNNQYKIIEKLFNGR